MPFCEGLIYQEYPQANSGKNVVKANWEALSKLPVILYDGLDNTLKSPVLNDTSGQLEYPMDLSGDIHYFEAV